jgi:hypothetical protein
MCEALQEVNGGQNVRLKKPWYSIMKSFYAPDALPLIAARLLKSRSKLAPHLTLGSPKQGTYPQFELAAGLSIILN